MSAPTPAAARADVEKRAAGRAAADEVESGMTLGLGTGSTVRYFLEALGEALASGRLRDVRGVPTSRATERLCSELAIPTLDLDEGLRLDLAIDGADEVDPRLELLKGLGGALLREKMVVQAADRFLVVVDSAKEVERLGERAPVPVEVVPFGWRVHLPWFRSLGAEPVPRVGAGGDLVVTDNGNHVVDLRFRDGIGDPAGLDARLQARAGVVETGLFLDVATRVLVGDGGGVVVRDRGAW